MNPMLLIRRYFLKPGPMLTNLTILIFMVGLEVGCVSASNEHQKKNIKRAPVELPGARFFLCFLRRYDSDDMTFNSSSYS